MKDWISAEAAAYPPGMNRAIARAIKQAIQKQRDRGTLFENKVRAWWEIDKNGKMKKCDNQANNEDETEEDECIYLNMARVGRQRRKRGK